MRDLLSIGTSRGCEMIGTGIGLGLSGYRVNPPGFPATLDLNFASSLSLTSSSGITPSFSRASTGTFFNSSGVLTTAAINAPRFNHAYNGSSWVSKGLLVEEQRTNPVQYSQLIGSTGWSLNNASTTNPVVTANFAAAPDGSTTASKIVFPSASGTQGSKVFQQNISMSVGYTISMFLKGDVGGEVVYLIGYNGTSYFSTTCTLTTSWQRFSASTGSSNQGHIQLGKESVIAGNMSACTVYAWGAQVEQGAFATSYIPNLTTGSTTRSADVCQITGGDFSGFWNASEGSFAAESYVNGFNASGVNYIGSASNGGLSQYAFIGRFNGSLTTLNFQVYNGAPAADILYTATSATPTKTAFGMKVSDCAASVNGGAVSADTTVTMTTTLTQLEIGNFLGNNYLNGHISRLRYYNTRLTNSQLQGLTL